MGDAISSVLDGIHPRVILAMRSSYSHGGISLMNVCSSGVAHLFMSPYAGQRCISKKKNYIGSETLPTSVEERGPHWCTDRMTSPPWKFRLREGSHFYGLILSPLAGRQRGRIMSEAAPSKLMSVVRHGARILGSENQLTSMCEKSSLEAQQSALIQDVNLSNTG
eukprot:1159755-Pelagomonas_calceolata.AAC.2